MSPISPSSHTGAHVPHFPIPLRTCKACGWEQEAADLGRSPHMRQLPAVETDQVVRSRCGQAANNHPAQLGEGERAGRMVHVCGGVRGTMQAKGEMLRQVQG